VHPILVPTVVHVKLRQQTTRLVVLVLLDTLEQLVQRPFLLVSPILVKMVARVPVPQAAHHILAPVTQLTMA